MSTKVMFKNKQEEKMQKLYARIFEINGKTTGS